MTTGTSLCPLTPPSAFCRSIRALKPAGDDEFWGPPGPVRSVMYAMVTGAAAEDAVVFVAEPPFEHPATTSGRAKAAVSKTLLICRFAGIFPPYSPSMVDWALTSIGATERVGNSGADVGASSPLWA